MAEAEVKAFELQGALAPLQGRWGRQRARAARRRLLAAGQVRRRPHRRPAALARRAGRPDLLRDARADGGDGPLRAQQRQIRFETFAMQRIRGAIIDELRSLDWVPRSVRSRAREIEEANSKLEHELGRAPTDAELAERSDIAESDLQDSLIQISNSSILALEELWMTPDASGDKVSLLDTIEDECAPDPQAALDTERGQGPPPGGDPGPARARDAGRRPLLLREPDPARDRRGARRHRVPRLAAALQGRAAAAEPLEDRRRLATPS